MFVVIGAWLAGLYLILRELIPLVRAWRTGVIRTRGHNGKTIRRDTEPRRFDNLCGNRLKGMRLGALAIGFGVLWLFLWIWALIPAVLVSLYLAAEARRPKKAPDEIVDEFA